MMTAILLVAIVLVALCLVVWVQGLLTGCTLTWVLECCFYQTGQLVGLLGGLIAEVFRINGGSSGD